MKQLIFPDKKSIPDAYKIDIPYKQSGYLINGVIKEWGGDTEKVYSPVYTENSGVFENHIGEYPLMGEEESLEALDAAAEAFNKGKGEWPTMTVRERIEAVRKFTILMKEKRDLKSLVEAENRYRKQLYAEVAKALKIDASQINKVAEIFAKEWQKSVR